ncbi:MAG TPA: hypothetical protein VNT92_05735 [Acidimicrobiia bacterium]|nr:hypothetical protein [Acidimicrobiia bacterium]
MAGGAALTVHLDGCHFKFTAGTVKTAGEVPGAVHVECPKEKQIQFTMAGGICVMDVYPQTLEAGITYTSIEGGGPGTKTPHDYVTVDIDITDALEYTDTDIGGIFCPFAGTSHNGDGDIVSTVRLKGYKGTTDHDDAGTPGQKDYTHSETEINIDVG